MLWLPFGQAAPKQRCSGIGNIFIVASLITPICPSDPSSICNKSGPEDSRGTCPSLLGCKIPRLVQIRTEMNRAHVHK
uniref:Uncharacterized protein n=1 Tax=Meloidogyne incognita TaxID=6306 RepID=A0A914LKN0_MELIC